MAGVKLYDLDALIAVRGLSATRALDKLAQDLDVYSTLLDKFLNQLPRTIPQLRRAVKEKNAENFNYELKGLRVDLADIFATELLARANLVAQAAESGDMTRCAGMCEPFINALQTLGQEIKECRTQEGIENEEQAQQTAAKLDIGTSLVNDRYSTVPKQKFLDLYTRIDTGEFDRAMNLAGIMKNMNFDSNILGFVRRILECLERRDTKLAFDNAAGLLKLLNVPVPQSVRTKFYVLVADDSNLAGEVRVLLGGDVRVEQAKTIDSALKAVTAVVKPDFIIISKRLENGKGFTLLDRLAEKRVFDIPVGLATENPAPQEIIAARDKNVSEFILLPIDIISFREKMRRYRGLVGK